MKWISPNDGYPNHEETVFVIVNEHEMEMVNIANCMYVLDDNDKLTDKRKWYHSGCECCYGHENVWVTYWCEIGELPFSLPAPVMCQPK